jgi:hypothetical protein
MSSTIPSLERIRLLRPETNRPNRAEVETAIRTLIRWAGEDPQRDGLIETPSRVARALEEAFAGYTQDPVEFLQKTFEEPVHAQESSRDCSGSAAALSLSQSFTKSSSSTACRTMS